ncbi:hypothetical protein OFP26_31865, partial [Escherichia coli]|nr:hypothetical protein [Escherichia coli]
MGVLPIFSQSIKDYFDSWLGTMTLLLSQLHSKDKAENLTYDAMAFLQGSLVMNRITGNLDYLKRCAPYLLSKWQFTSSI